MIKMRPFFSFFGGKWRLALRYPAPQQNTIIEPFAGSAGYSTRYYDRKIILVERDPKIAALWKYLIKVRAAEIRSLPEQVDDLDDENICEEAKTLIGFWLSRGSTTPRKSPSAWMRTGKWPSSFWGEAKKERIAKQVEHIRHWKIIEGSYESSPNCEATWFIDPPYQAEGSAYKYNKVDYPSLIKWINVREGLCLVCEQRGASWAPFRSFHKARSIAKETSHEVLYVRGSVVDFIIQEVPTWSQFEQRRLIEAMEKIV